MAEQNKRRRQAKISAEQKEIYCAFMEENPSFCRTKHCDASVQELWQLLCTLLNSTGGVYHSVDEWKKVFDNWRYGVTYKIRLQKADAKTTGGGSPRLKKPIDRLEERAMACWGRIAVDGHPSVSVAGFTEFEEANKFSNETETTDAPADDDHLNGFICVNSEDTKGIGIGQKPKRQKRSTTKTLDDEFICLLKTSEESKLTQTELICSKLDKVAESIDALTSAQRATTAAIEKLVAVLSNQQ